MHRNSLQVLNYNSQLLAQQCLFRGMICFGEVFHLSISATVEAPNVLNTVPPLLEEKHDSFGSQRWLAK